MSWTEDRVNDLKRMWADGQSMAQIAQELGGGATRNSVIGKVHRLGLCVKDGGRDKAAKDLGVEPGRKLVRQKASSPAPQKERRPAAQSPSQPFARPFRPVEVQVTPPTMPETEHTGPAAIKLLSEGACKWPVGDPTQPSFRFCGCKANTGLSYCSYHHGLAYQAPRQRTPENNSRQMHRFAGAY
jgi:GcrA cell cycle regulator